MLKFTKIAKFISGHHESQSSGKSQYLSFSEPSQIYMRELLQLCTNQKFKEVLSKLKSDIKSFPGSAVLFNIQGASNAALGQHSAATASYKKALQL